MSVENVRSSILPALAAGADFAEVGVGINACGVVVVPGELDGIVSDRCGANHFDWAFAVNREGVGLRFDFWRLIAAGSAGAVLAQICVGVSGLMAIGPSNLNATGSGEFDGCGGEVHISCHWSAVSCQLLAPDCEIILMKNA